jgi:hypothetical protein
MKLEELNQDYYFIKYYREEVVRDYTNTMKFKFRNEYKPRYCIILGKIRMKYLKNIRRKC